MRHRLRARTLNEVVGKALDALAAQEGWDDLQEGQDG